MTDKLHDCYQLPSWADNPFLVNYAPEMDTTEPFDLECSSFYQHLIGVTHWMVELGHIDFATEISLLSSHLAYPREGHLEAALHVMAYLKSRNKVLALPLTRPTPILTCLPSPPMTGPSSMGMYRKLSHTTYLNPWVKTLTFACFRIVTTQERSVPGIPTLAS